MEDDSAGDETTYQLCAPAGKVWACDLLHLLVVTWCDPSERERAVSDGIDRMRHGVESCTEVDCEICHPTEEP